MEYSLGQGSANYLLKLQIVNILGFMGDTVCVASKVCHYSMKAIMKNGYVRTGSGLNFGSQALVC